MWDCEYDYRFGFIIQNRNGWSHWNACIPNWSHRHRILCSPRSPYWIGVTEEGLQGDKLSTVTFSDPVTLTQGCLLIVVAALGYIRISIRGNNWHGVGDIRHWVRLYRSHSKAIFLFSVAVTKAPIWSYQVELGIGTPLSRVRGSSIAV